MNEPEVPEVSEMPAYEAPTLTDIGGLDEVTQGSLLFGDDDKFIRLLIILPS
jgi:16S rRNA U516 pseudouridylate synthase RsuA-like enzyme